MFINTNVKVSYDYEKRYKVITQESTKKLKPIEAVDKAKEGRIDIRW